MCHLSHSNSKFTLRYAKCKVIWLAELVQHKHSISQIHPAYGRMQKGRTPAMLPAHRFHLHPATLGDCGHAAHMKQDQKHQEKLKLLPLLGNSSVMELPVCEGPRRQKQNVSLESVKGCVVIKFFPTLFSDLKYCIRLGCILWELCFK